MSQFIVIGRTHNIYNEKKNLKSGQYRLGFRKDNSHHRAINVVTSLKHLLAEVIQAEQNGLSFFFLLSLFKKKIACKILYMIKNSQTILKESGSEAITNMKTTSFCPQKPAKPHLILLPKVYIGPPQLGPNTHY